MCGEKWILPASPPTALGSPPRVRGKGCCRLPCSQRTGITPACAGKSNTSDTRGNSPRDHPRVCGEKLYPICFSMEPLGSPPRVRGKGLVLLATLWPLGITPACAGKRLKRSHSIGHFSCILCLFHSVLHRASVSGGSRAGPCAPPCLPAQNAVPV